MNLIFRCLTVLLTLIGNEAVFAFSGIGNTLDFGELAAFPGAEGYGRMTTGGRGGEVYIVTSLADDGMPGTLRYGIEKLDGPRTIIFQVSGTIFLHKDLKIRKGNLTIAGQTAPGNGICLTGVNFRINLRNPVII